MNKERDMSNSISIFDLEENEGNSQVPSNIQFAGQPKDFVQGYFPSVTPENFTTGTPRVIVGSRIEIDNPPSLHTFNTIPSESKPDTVNDLKPIDPPINEKETLSTKEERTETQSSTLPRSSINRRLRMLLNYAKHQKEDNMTMSTNSTESLSVVKPNFNLSSQLESSLIKRGSQGGEKARRLSEGGTIEEEWDERDSSRGPGKRWRKVAFLMQALTHMKKHNKCTKDLELNHKQLELLHDLGIQKDQKPQPPLKSQLSQQDFPILNRSASIISQPKSKFPIFAKVLNFFCTIRQKKQQIASELFLKRKLKRRSEGKQKLLEKLKKPISPSSKFRLGWDVLLMFLVVIDMIILPLQISFSVLGDQGYQYFTDGIFFIDILLSFHTAFYQNGDLVTDHKQIAKNYGKTWLIIDFLSVLPLHAIEEVQPDTPDLTFFNKPSFLKLFRILRLIKVLRALRFFKLNKIFWKFKVFFGYSQAHSFFQLLKLIIIVVLLSHWLACIWHLVAVFELEFGDGNPWLETENRHLLDADPSVRYINSLYWSVTTMLTVGYGDITPVSVPELWCAVFAMFFACGVFAYSLNAIGTIVNDLSQSKAKVR